MEGGVANGRLRALLLGHSVLALVYFARCLWIFLSAEPWMARRCFRHSKCLFFPRTHHTPLRAPGPRAHGSCYLENALTLHTALLDTREQWGLWRIPQLSLHHESFWAPNLQAVGLNVTWSRCGCLLWQRLRKETSKGWVTQPG